MSSKIQIVGLVWWATEETLNTAFSKFGTITETIVVYDRETHKCRGLGYVTYSSHDEALQAVNGMDGHELEGRRITVTLYPANA